jgi:soluble lytic murein transglycosylase-like protein
MTRLYLLALVAWHSLTHGFDPRIIYAQAMVESSLNPAAVCRNCKGLMQVDVKVWGKALNIDESRILEPSYNLDIALDILQHYYQRTGDVWLALHWYNNGPSGKHNNRRYVEKIRAILEAIK